MGGAAELRLWVRKTREAKRMAGTGAYNPIPSHVGRVLLSSCLGSCGWIGREEVREELGSCSFLSCFFLVYIYYLLNR